MIDMVQKTWDELGFKVRPVRRNVVVRTHPLTQKTQSGLLWLPPKQTGFYGQLPHVHMVRATVLAVGPLAAQYYNVKVGEEIAFQRLHFGKFYDLNAEEKVGWIDASQVAGYPED